MDVDQQSKLRTGGKGADKVDSTPVLCRITAAPVTNRDAVGDSARHQHVVELAGRRCTRVEVTGHQSETIHCGPGVDGQHGVEVAPAQINAQ